MSNRITMPTIEITENEGFSKNDLFHQKDFAEKLTNLIENGDDELVIGLDSRWGEGKTTFSKMWQSMLIHEKDIHCIYFDAFENDHITDPFLALSSQIYQLIREAKDPEHVKSFTKSAVSVMKVAAKSTLSIGVKHATANVLDLNDFFDDDIDKDIVGEVSKSADKYFSKKLLSAEKDKKSLSDFKKELNKLPKYLGTDKKIVFMIDELDRCRPPFSLELLEKIKHIFSAKSIVFVLITNKYQLQESIRCEYGQGIDANEYLQKFVKLWVSFTNESYKIRQGKRVKYLYHCISSMLPDVEERADISGAEEMLSDLVRHYALTLREIEQLVSYFSLYTTIAGIRLNDDYQIIPSFLCLLKVKFPEIFEKLSHGLITYEKLIGDADIANLESSSYYFDPNESKPHKLLIRLELDLAPEGVREALADKYAEKGYTIPSNVNIIKGTCKLLNNFNIY